MKIAVRQITRRAGGADIVRNRTIEAASIVIGRGPECDIRIPDLSVSLRHARLHSSVRGHATVEALSALPLEIGHRSTMEAEIDLRFPTQLLLGQYTLTIAHGTEADDIAVTVMHDTKRLPERAEAHRTFEPRTPGLQPRSLSWIFAAAIVFLCLLLPIAAFLIDGVRKPTISAAQPDRQWSTGPLSPGHHFLEKNCKACHQDAFVAVRDNACIACHRTGSSNAGAIQLAASVKAQGSPFFPDPIGPHGAADRLYTADPATESLDYRLAHYLWGSTDHPAAHCTACHTEHIKMPVALRSEKQAHSTPPDLLNRFDCATCHADMKARLTDTKLSDAPDWVHHPDFRPRITLSVGSNLSTARVSLSAMPFDNTGLKFSHRDHLDPRGAATRMAVALGAEVGYGAALSCASCHRPDAKRTGFLPIEMERDCKACHALHFDIGDGRIRELPHGDPVGLVRAVAAFSNDNAPVDSDTTRRKAGYVWPATEPQSALAVRILRIVFSPRGVCFECHTVLPPLAHSVMPRVAAVHLANRFLPAGAFDHSVRAHHEDQNGAATCSSCHQANRSDKSSDVLIPHVASCAKCHGQPASTGWTAAAETCIECHGYHDQGKPSFEASTPIDWTHQTARRTAGL
ncbi:MAG TPA: FHA domain-containing protein [Rhizomicrobium sp.]